MAWPSTKAVTFSNGGSCTPANLNSIQDQFLRPGGILLSDLNVTVPIPPLGTILPYGGSAAPDSNWKLADGAAISRSTYADLFALIGTTYGAGDGSTTFNIPDTRGRVMVGKGVNAPTDTLGETGGVADVTLTTANLPSHSHTGTTGGMSANHRHFLNYMFGAYVSGGIPLTVFAHQAGTIVTTGGENTGHTHTVSTDNDGGAGQSHINLMPYLTHNFIIRVL